MKWVVRGAFGFLAAVILLVIVANSSANKKSDIEVHLTKNLGMTFNDAKDSNIKRRVGTSQNGAILAEIVGGEKPSKVTLMVQISEKTAEAALTVLSDISSKFLGWNVPVSQLAKAAADSEGANTVNMAGPGGARMSVTSMVPVQPILTVVYHTP